MSEGAFKPVILSLGKVSIHILPYGLTLHRFLVELSDGSVQDLIVNPEDPRNCAAEGRTFKSPIVGRYANRLPAGKTALPGHEGAYIHTTASPGQAGGVSLHGGPAKGWDQIEWSHISRSESQLFSEADQSFPLASAEAIFALASPDGDQGFPHALHVEALFQLRPVPHSVDVNYPELVIVYRAKIVNTKDTTALTPINLTHHTGWTLNPYKEGDKDDISDHYLTIAANDIVELDAFTSLATGDTVHVYDSPKRLDLSRGEYLGEGFLQEGIDDNYLFHRSKDAAEQEIVALLYHRHSPIHLTFKTNQSSVMSYTGNGFNPDDGSTRKALHGNVNKPYPKYGAVFLEFHAPVGTFLHPKLIEHNGGDNTLLRLGQIYEAWHSTEVHIFDQ